MNALMVLRVALKALRVNKLRSSLTMLGMIIGVAAVIAMLAIGGGAQERVREQLKNLGSNLMLIFPGSTTASGVRLGVGAAQTLTEEDAQALAIEVEGVVVAAPSVRGSGQVSAGNANWATQYFGTNNDYLIARDWPLASGRLFEPAEISGAGKVALRAAPAGTGIIAGGPMRAVFESLGVADVVTKSVGTSNPYNMIRATFEALKEQTSPRSVAQRRGKKVSDLLGRGGMDKGEAEATAEAVTE